MEMAADARRALPALLGLYMGRQDALRSFPISVRAFWRVFWLALGVIATAEVLISGLAAHEHGGAAMLQAAIIALSVLGGTTMAIQIVLAVGTLEDWGPRSLFFLVPLLWIGVALWGAATAWRIAALGLDLHGGALGLTLLGSCAAYGAWQAARQGLKLGRGAALGVIFVYALAQFGGYALVNATLWLLPG